MVQAVQDSCRCSYGPSDINREDILCIDETDGVVTYQARVLSTAEVDTDGLVSALDRWVDTRPTVVVGGIELRVESGCQISALFQVEQECPAGQSLGGGSNAAVVATVAEGMVAVLAITASIM